MGFSLNQASAASSMAASSQMIVMLAEHRAGIDPSLMSEKLSLELEVPVTLLRPMSGNALVVRVEHPEFSRASIQNRLRALSDVADVVSDAVVTPTTVSDPRFEEQWQLHAPEPFYSSLNVINAWDITHGSSDVVVAVVDTGIIYEHPDLTGRILPGYDFVSSLKESVDGNVTVPDDIEFLRSHDGDARDMDASDPGDSINEQERLLFDSIDIECYMGKSSWHGTAMASIIAANVDDGIGIAGIDRHAKILPVRAIGKCGGRRSDMLDAIRWAAGVNDPNLPPNPTPARIINLSLGVDDLCTTADQSAINEAVDAGAVIVAAVGNNGRNTDAYPSSPSHCQNVIGVMASDKYGFRASYSNFGRDADIAAPGGDLSPATHNILVATDLSMTNPGTDFGYRSATGTSVASPHVAGVLALMLSINPDLTNRELEALLMDSTRSFPQEDDPQYSPELMCEQSFCGAGILDAFAAVQAVSMHQPGVQLDSPGLAAAQSEPVSVGEFTGFGCTVSNLRSTDPMLFLLGMASAILLLVRRRPLGTKNRRLA